MLELLDEIHDVPARREHHRTLDGVLELAHGGRAGQRPARNHLVRKLSHHHLLTHHPVEVSARQVVALADEAQRLRAVQLLPAGRKVGPGKRFVDGLFQAYVHAAEGVGDQGEAKQADLGVVVDRDAGEVGDGLDQRLAAGLGGLRLGLGGVHALVLDEFLHLVELHLAVDTVDLRLAEPGRLDIGVTRNRDSGRRLPVVGDAHQDDRVGVGRDVVAGVQRGQFLLRQRVAVRVRAAVHADQQDVDRAVLTAAAERGGTEVEDPALEGPDLAPGHPGTQHHHDGEQRHHGPAHPPRTGHRRHFGLGWHQPRLLARWAHTR